MNLECHQHSDLVEEKSLRPVNRQFLTGVMGIALERCAAIVIAIVGLASCETPADPGVGGVRLVIESAAVVIARGDTLTVVATAYDARGRPTTAKLDWSVEHPTVARVNTNGLVYGNSAGVTRIIAATGALRAETAVTVSETDGGWRSVGANCGIWHTGDAYCWQSNIAVPDTISAPVKLPVNLGTVRQTFEHLCGLTELGEAYCWGENDYGQLGDGSLEDRSVPVAVAGGIRFDSIAVGALHTCGLTPDGSVYCWGAGAAGQLGIGTPPEACRAVPCSRVPRQVASTERFISVAAGGNDRVGSGSPAGMTCGITRSHTLLCWGQNAHGSLGDGTRMNRMVPTAVSGNNRYVAAAVGGFHACAVDENSHISCWGGNTSGQLGSVLPTGAQYECAAGDIAFACTSAPQQVAGLYRSISAAVDNTCAIDLFGAAWCWGRNDFGQLGTGTRGGNAGVPGRVVGGMTFLQIWTGLSITCGLAPDRSIRCWGNSIPRPILVPTPSR